MESPNVPPRASEDEVAALVTSLRIGDRRAGELLDRLYRDVLIRFCWGYLGRVEEAEDAVQDICYKVLTAERVPDSFRTWLYRTARNHCLNLLRSRQRRKDVGVVPALSQIHESLTGHLTRLVREEERGRVESLVRSLPDDQREALHLRYVESLSRSEIAEVLEVSESVVKSRLFEGIKRLRDYLSFVDPS